MLYLIREEWAVHQCEDADHYTNEHRQEMTLVAGNPYSDGVRRLYMTDHDHELWIKYCPWCGCDLDLEKISPDKLPKRYIHPLWKNTMEKYY